MKVAKVYESQGSGWNNVPFKAVRENNRWRFYFRHNKWSPWEEYVLPW